MESDHHRMLCHVCDTFDTLPYEEHVMTKQHQICSHQQEYEAYRMAHGIYINNLPTAASKEEIISFFAKYGRILSSIIYGNNVYGIIEYEEAQVVTNLITGKKVDFNGCNIAVRSRSPKSQKKYVNEEPPRVNPFEVVQLLRSETDIVREIVTLQCYLQPTSRDVFYAALCMDLKGVLAQYMQCVVYPFGSTITGLDFNTSDVDAYVYVDPRDRLCGKMTGDALARKLVQIIPPFLCNSQLFAKVVSIPNANTPIVKCVHMRTGIACDINFKNMLGVCNSYLIKKYLSYNRRLTIALLIIKYWIKVHNLSGVGKFSNYSVCVLFLYRFMQEPYNLPTIYKLQKNHACNIQDGWDAGFEFGDFVLSDALNRLGVAELLFEFFKFYSNFNYADVVICPYIGKALDRSVFLESGVLPYEYNRYKLRLSADGIYPTTPICVQDFFELRRNVTRAVRVQEFDEFVEICGEGLSKLNPEINDNAVLLYPIFYSSWYTHDDAYQFVLIETQKLKTYLRKQNNATILNNTQQLFHNFLKDFITRVLTQIYLFNAIVETPEITICSSPPMKLQKKNNQIDSHDLNIVFDCESHVDVWTSRSIIMKDHTKIADENLFDAEIRLSNYIANTVCKNIKTKHPLLKVKVALQEETEGEKNIKVNITNCGTNLIAYKDFGAFFAKFVKNFYIRYITSLIDRSQTVSETVKDKE